MNIKELKEVLVISNKVVKDECGDLSIFGKEGKIYTDEDHWYLFQTGRNWNEWKKKLNFMEVWQDGDAEGVLRLNRLPLEKEVLKIRKAVGLGKKRKAGEHLKSFAFKPRTQM
jgi:hypothetical protein